LVFKIIIKLKFNNNSLHIVSNDNFKNHIIFKRTRETTVLILKKI
jgi:hypothetical protein